MVDGQQHRNVEVVKLESGASYAFYYVLFTTGPQFHSSKTPQKFRYRFFEPAGFDLTLERYGPTCVSSRLAAVILCMAVPLDADCWP